VSETYIRNSRDWPSFHQAEEKQKHEVAIDLLGATIISKGHQESNLVLACHNASTSLSARRLHRKRHTSKNGLIRETKPD
jgi:hypothetical protein